MIDQTKLPNTLEFVTYTDFNQIADAIRTLVVRGAPAIGVSGAFGLALAALQSDAKEKDELINYLENAKNVLFETRPTAVNLAWGLQKIMQIAKRADTVDEIRKSVVEAAKKMADEDIQINMSLGKNGSELFNDNDTVMTHCNAGALATVGYGTALGVIRATKESGKNIKVIATETRPVQQGSRLTAFELKHDGIDVSLIPDTAVGYTMANGLVNKIIVGADRVLQTGHVYNKIGTYQVATMAKQHNIPFYVAAPLSTFDLESSSEDVIIEQRKASEVTGLGDKKTAPDGIDVINPAFDMTPPELISGIITENGIVKPHYRNKNPKTGGYNLAEKFDLRFIEENPVIQDCMSKVLGPDYNILLKKFIVAVPLEYIPDWIKKETKNISSTNLGPYIKPEYADMTYFVGVDFHQDIIDHKDRLADFVTLYVYLDDVNENMSPLVISPHSHTFGVTTFPHDIILNDGKKTITYNDGNSHSDIFQVKKILGKKGSVNFWTSLTLHGTEPSPKNSQTRISLRYLIEKNKKNKVDYLIDKLNQQIKGQLSSSRLRVDQDEDGKIIISGNVLNKQH